MKQLRPLFLLLASTIACAAKPDAYDEGFALTLSRSACYGPCPVYRVSVDALGTVIFEPEKFTSVTKPQTLALSPEKIAQLVEDLQDAWFFERPHLYEPGKTACKLKRFWTDHPGFEISASAGKQKNWVRVNTGCLEVDQALIHLPAELEQILGIEELVYGGQSGRSL